MANTTNFGWETPDDTDLVKDGAAAMRTLGNAIDTSLVDLKGGTSGQILSKNSNTDMDFVWITNDVGDITNVGVTSPITGGGSSGSVTIGIEDGTTAQKGAVQLEDSTSSTSTTKAATPNSVKSAYDLANAAIPKSLVDAAGDLIYATANDTVARLALGTAGQVLKVNSGATAPEWAAATTGATSWSLVNTGGTSLSGTSTSVTGISDANELLIIIQQASLNAQAGIRFRINSDTGNNYTSAIVFATGASTWAAGNIGNSWQSAQSWGFIGEMSSNAGSLVTGYIRISGCNSSGLKTFHSAAGGSAATGSGHEADFSGGFWNNSATVSSIQIVSGSANTFDNGTVWVYKA